MEKFEIIHYIYQTVLNSIGILRKMLRTFIREENERIGIREYIRMVDMFFKVDGSGYRGQGG